MRLVCSLRVGGGTAGEQAGGGGGGVVGRVVGGTAGVVGGVALAEEDSDSRQQVAMPLVAFFVVSRVWAMWWAKTNLEEKEGNSCVMWQSAAIVWNKQSWVTDASARHMTMSCWNLQTEPNQEYYMMWQCSNFPFLSQPPCPSQSTLST